MTSHELSVQPWNQYSLSQEEVSKRAATLLDTYPPQGDEQLVCYMLDDADPANKEFTDMARTMECRIFDSRFGNDAKKMHQMYGVFDASRQSLFFVSLDKENREVAGVLRVIRNGVNGFKTLNDMASSDLLNVLEYIERVREYYGITDMNTCWDIATAAVPPEYRGSSPLIYRGLLVAAQRAGIQHLFSVIDEAAFRPMEALGFPFKPLLDKGWMPYEDSERSLPVHGYVADFEASIQAREEDMLREGRGRLVARMAFGQIGRGTKDNALQF